MIQADFPFLRFQQGFPADARNPPIPGKSLVQISHVLTSLAHQHFIVLSLYQQYKEPTHLDVSEIVYLILLGKVTFFFHQFWVFSLD